MDLVSELCGKLRDLERAEEANQHQQPEVLEGQVETMSGSNRSNMATGTKTTGGARNKESVKSTTASASTKARTNSKSNPYYQMFPALSGNAPALGAGSSTRGAVAMAKEGANWGQQGNSYKLKVEGGAVVEGNAEGGAAAVVDSGELRGGGGAGERRMSNASSTQELFTGGTGGDKGTERKRKNKKRRTNGESRGDFIVVCGKVIRKETFSGV